MLGEMMIILLLLGNTTAGAGCVVSAASISIPGQCTTHCIIYSTTTTGSDHVVQIRTKFR